VIHRLRALDGFGADAADGGQVEPLRRLRGEHAGDKDDEESDGQETFHSQNPEPRRTRRTRSTHEGNARAVTLSSPDFSVSSSCPFLVLFVFP
jgi:hypothetical protein